MVVVEGVRLPAFGKACFLLELAVALDGSVEFVPEFVERDETRLSVGTESDEARVFGYAPAAPAPTTTAS